jgi:hypothetical protein
MNYKKTEGNKKYMVVDFLKENLLYTFVLQWC